MTVADDDFDGQVVLVTGAARGSGRSHARRFGQSGADLVLVDCCAAEVGEQYPLASREDLDETASTVEASDGDVLALELDVRDSEALGRAVSRATSERGTRHTTLPRNTASSG